MSKKIKVDEWGFVVEIPKERIFDFNDERDKPKKKRKKKK